MHKDLSGTVGLGSRDSDTELKWSFQGGGGTHWLLFPTSSMTVLKGDDIAFTIDEQSIRTNVGTLKTIETEGLGQEWIAKAGSIDQDSGCHVTFGVGLGEGHGVQTHQGHYELNLSGQDPIRIGPDGSSYRFEQGDRVITDFGVQRDVVDLISACQLKPGELDELDRQQDLTEVTRLGVGGDGLAKAALAVPLPVDAHLVQGAYERLTH